MSPKHSFVKLQGDDVEDEDVTSFSKRQRKLQGITFLWMLSALEAVAIGVFAVLLLTRPLSVKECATQLSVYCELQKSNEKAFNSGVSLTISQRLYWMIPILSSMRHSIFLPTSISPHPTAGRQPPKEKLYGRSSGTVCYS